jgi:hypothetical protein
MDNISPDLHVSAAVKMQTEARRLLAQAVKAQTDAQRILTATVRAESDAQRLLTAQIAAVRNADRVLWPPSRLAQGMGPSPTPTSRGRRGRPRCLRDFGSAYPKAWWKLKERFDRFPHREELARELGHVRVRTLNRYLYNYPHFRTLYPLSRKKP